MKSLFWFSSFSSGSLGLSFVFETGPYCVALFSLSSYLRSFVNAEITEGRDYTWLCFYLKEQAEQMFKVLCFSQTFIRPIVANSFMQMSLIHFPRVIIYVLYFINQDSLVLFTLPNQVAIKLHFKCFQSVYKIFLWNLTQLFLKNALVILWWTFSFFRWKWQWLGTISSSEGFTYQAYSHALHVLSDLGLAQDISVVAGK